MQTKSAESLGLKRSVADVGATNTGANGLGRRALKRGLTTGVKVDVGAASGMIDQSIRNAIKTHQKRVILSVLSG